MGRIRVLSDTVANKIAAGEVVERPASVVKELLENSLDAGSTSIRIEAESGGRRLIRIVDDGCGMLRDDAMLAFERHATSKLHDVHDLVSIATLGFRGEALPSIASVSRLLLETRAPEEHTGAVVEIAGGKMLRCDEAALPPGTSITVRDLFFNVPARKKFLRTDQTELAHIASLVTHYSLAHPDKSFQLTAGGSDLLHVTPAASLRDRVYQVFGGETLDDLVELGERRRELRLPPPYVPPSEAIAEFKREPDEPSTKLFALRGFVSRPQVQKGNRNSIYIFVNGRLIRDRLLLHAISSAYHNLIPPGTFPFALLFLETEFNEVDVNVHPSKTEVRFRHQSFVHDFVRDALREALMESRPAPAFSPAPPRAPSPAASPAQPAAGLPYSEFSQMMENAAAADAEVPAFTLQAQPGPAPRLDFGDAPAFAAPAPGPRFAAVAPAEGAPAGPPPPRRVARVPDTHGGFPEGALASTAGASLDALRDLRPLGQLHNSFIVAAGRDGLWIVDQHVAHERILFEQVLAQRAAGRPEVQQLLMPLIVQITPEQQVRYARIAEELAAAGFESEPFGARTLAIQAAPAAIPPGELERVLFEILEIPEEEMRALSLDEIRRDIAASIACRAAIKINMPLDMQKMEWLLRQLAATEYPMSCPHGRPIALQYSTREILKAFHRI